MDMQTAMKPGDLITSWCSHHGEDDKGYPTPHVYTAGRYAGGAALVCGVCHPDAATTWGWCPRCWVRTEWVEQDGRKVCGSCGAEVGK